MVQTPIGESGGLCICMSTRQCIEWSATNQVLCRDETRPVVVGARLLGYRTAPRRVDNTCAPCYRPCTEARYNVLCAMVTGCCAEMSYDLFLCMYLHVTSCDKNIQMIMVIQIRRESVSINKTMQIFVVNLARLQGCGPARQDRIGCRPLLRRYRMVLPWKLPVDTVSKSMAWR